MMAGNPNLWSNMHPTQVFFPSRHANLESNNSSLSLEYSSQDQHHMLHTQYPTPQSSWNQLLLSGSSSASGLSSGDNEDRFGTIYLSQFQQNKKVENWDDQMFPTVNPLPPSARLLKVHDNVKQEESSIKRHLYGQADDHEELRGNRSAYCASWSKVIQVSSPRPCVTTLVSSTNDTTLEFNNYDNNLKEDIGRKQTTDHFSECNSTTTTAICKKPRVQPYSSQPPLKVRKEKLGDRITALHQLVSPFGKIDTASVLIEAIGCIRFLQSQVEVLTAPYLGQALTRSRNNNKQCVYMEGGEKEKQKDLRSRGLCLVPVSCTHHVVRDNGAYYWAPPSYANGFSLHTIK